MPAPATVYSMYSVRLCVLQAALKYMGVIAFPAQAMWGSKNEATARRLGAPLLYVLDWDI